MNLARFSVSRPVAAGIISVALFVLGLYYGGKLPVSLYPEVSMPFVSVVVPMPGASVEQIEKKIVKPLEKELASIEGVKRVIGRIKPGVATVVLGFKMSVDEKEAVNQTREKVSVLRATFPEGAKDPIVTRVDVGATPILVYGIGSAQSPEVTKKILDDGLVRELQRTDGVNEAQVVGLGEERVEIALDPARLAAARIPALDVYQKLSQNLQTIPWGDVQQAGQVLAVTRASLPQDPAFWNDYTITLSDGRTVRLGEIATVTAARDEDAAAVRIDGKPGLGLVVTKRADANTVDTVKKVGKVVSALDAGTGVKLFPIIDQSDYIEENAHEVWIALFAGGAFAVLVVFLFLTDVKSAVITATALPVSVAGTFIFMSFLGFSINMMSLLALALAIGLLIDDAVVVRESIFSEIEAGKSAKEAAVAGTDKVAGAVLATTLAVVAVFVPVSMMEGMVGQFFKEFGLTIVIAVVLSLWVAFTLDPMLSAKFGGHHKPLQGRVWDAWRGFLTKTEHGAARLASRAFSKPLRYVGLAAALLVVSAGLLLARGSDFLAFEDRGQLVLNVAAPSGSPREATQALADEAYERIKGIEGLTEVYASVGGADQTRAEMRLVFVPKTERARGLIEIQADIKKRLEGVKGEILVMEPPPVEGVGAEAPLAVYVYGEDFDQLFKESERLTAEIGKIPGVAAIRIETSRHSPGVDVSLANNELGFWGTTAAAVESTGRLALTGLEAGHVGADNLPVLVRYGKDDRTIERLWNDTYVPTPKGPVLVASLATQKPAVTPTKIDREKRSRKVMLWGTLDRSRSFGLVLADVEALLKSVPAPMYAEVGGDKEMFEEMNTNFAIAIVGSAFFIFLILAIQFENLVRPFVILLTLPLAMIGAFLALFFAGEKLALGAFIGIILLIGLAAKNGILLVDAIGAKEKGDKAMSLADAVRQSVFERFRPILMTSVAMIFGMLPTAVMRGGGSEFRAPMAIAIIGGVVSSTLLSVVIVPAIFGLLAKIKAWRAAKGSATAHVAGHVPAVAGKALLLAGLVAGGLVAAEPGRAAEDETPRADMKRVVEILRAKPAKDSKEGFTLKAASEAADGLTSSSRRAFLGGLKLEAGREWTTPGVTQDITLPLPPQIGGPVTSEVVLVPTAQNVYTIGWSLPLFNLQVVKGLKVAEGAREQRDAVEIVQAENAARVRAQLLLQYEMAQKVRRTYTERVTIAESRAKSVEAKVIAGTARRSQQDEATAALESARADLERAKTDLQRLRVRFAAETGTELPEEGLGLPRFPVALGEPFNPAALKALDAAERVRDAAVDVIDAGFAPTVEATAAHQRKEFGEGSPEPQNALGLKLSWTLLDAGTRRRNAADAKRELYLAKAETAGTRLELKAAYDALRARYEGAMHGLAARRAAQAAAAQAAADAVHAFQSGTIRLLDVRTADEARLGADLGVFQAEVELEAIALESLVLTGRLLPYLESQNG